MFDPEISGAVCGRVLSEEVTATPGFIGVQASECGNPKCKLKECFEVAIVVCLPDGQVLSYRYDPVYSRKLGEEIIASSDRQCADIVKRFGPGTH